MPGSSRHHEHPHHGGALGSRGEWREDDMRVAIIVVVIATIWILLAIRSQMGDERWFENLFGFGLGKGAPSFER